MKFVDVDPKEIPNLREGRRGRVSYPILKSFLETGKLIVMLDRTDLSRSYMSLYAGLSAYAKNHNLPIKVLGRSNQIYLLRLDLDEEGNTIEDWQKREDKEEKPETDIVATPLDAKAVVTRAKK